ncbi:MAG: type II secretion system protein [Synergistaceae bacterium]|nr:type II secretion system protein [Synergistaceae bacterium]MBR0095414.1 type II secretion system protein [Synergistaceae bacterium]
MKRCKRGFTLIELLIVIVVIGVLSAMMMLSSTEAASSAEAIKIVNNLRNWKTAALEWYADNYERVKETGRINVESGSDGFRYKEAVPTGELVKYLGEGGLTVNSDGTVTDDDGGIYYTDFLIRKDIGGKEDRINGVIEWLIIYKMPDDDYKIKEKLEARAETSHLVNKTPTTEGDFHDPYKADTEQSINVGIRVIDFSKQ